MKFSGTLDKNLGPKYLKQFRPSLVLGLSNMKSIFLCERTELASVNLLCSTSNPVIVLHINLKTSNLFTLFNFTGWPKNLETWKNLEFHNLGKKNLEKPRIWEILKKNLEFWTKVFKKPWKTWIFNNFYKFSSKSCFDTKI